MVKHLNATLDATFAALSDPTRRALLARLAAASETSVSDLAAPFDLSLPAITKHLKVLEHAGLIAHRKTGRVRRCRLLAAPLKEAAEWMQRYQRFWEDRLDALARYLEQQDAAPETAPMRPPRERRPPRRRKESR